MANQLRNPVVKFKENLEAQISNPCLKRWCPTLKEGISGLKFQGGYEGNGLHCPWSGLGAPLKDSHRLCDFPIEKPFTGMEVPFTKDKWPCPFRNEIWVDTITWHGAWCLCVWRMCRWSSAQRWVQDSPSRQVDKSWIEWVWVKPGASELSGAYRSLHVFSLLFTNSVFL